MTPQGSINYWQLGQNLSFQIKFQISQNKKKLEGGREPMASVPYMTFMISRWHSVFGGAGFGSHGLLVKYCQKSQGEAILKMSSLGRESFNLFCRFWIRETKVGNLGCWSPHRNSPPRSEFSVSLGLVPQWGKHRDREAASKQMRPLIYHKKEDWLLRFYWITIKAPSTRSLWFYSRHHSGRLKS